MLVHLKWVSWFNHLGHKFDLKKDNFACMSWNLEAEWRECYHSKSVIFSKPSPISCGHWCVLQTKLCHSFVHLGFPFGGWSLYLHSEYLLIVAFLWTCATPCCFPSACLSCLYGETVWCHDLLCVNYHTFPCFSAWGVCSFFKKIWCGDIYLAVLYCMLLCSFVSAQVWADDGLFNFR